MPDWERRLFALYNDCAWRAAARLVVAAHACRPVDLGVALPDLRSRLAAMPHYALRPLDEAQQREALQLRARARGLELPEETAALPAAALRARHGAACSALLEQLDAASLRSTAAADRAVHPRRCWRHAVTALQRRRGPDLRHARGRASARASCDSLDSERAIRRGRDHMRGAIGRAAAARGGHAPARVGQAHHTMP